MSLIDEMPIDFEIKPRIADSRPEPTPFTVTATSFNAHGLRLLFQEVHQLLQQQMEFLSLHP
jgi:hypothetical protein